MALVLEPLLTQDPALAPAAGARLDSIFDMVVAGGPVMIPLALSSVLALAYAFERMLRLRARALGTNGFERELEAALSAGGVARGVELCQQRSTPAARVMRVALVQWGAPFAEREKLVEDAARREVRALSANLKPLVYISMLAPLLGFLGTVYGMIVAFTTVALHEGLGRPELLAAGISQALITTAAGLTIAVPTQVLYFWLKSRVDTFARRVEELYAHVAEHLTLGAPIARTPAAPTTPPPAAPDIAVQPA
ncbi:MAG: MotA/TolQ/ExbB proton channel family protein [Planctomycetes bacterium]|nr:MotA/TolQ/ExbB proton channel family protein [Planctomycetota bacterium]